MEQPATGLDGRREDRVRLATGGGLGVEQQKRRSRRRPSRPARGPVGCGRAGDGLRTGAGTAEARKVRHSRDKQRVQLEIQRSVRASCRAIIAGLCDSSWCEGKVNEREGGSGVRWLVVARAASRWQCFGAKGGKVGRRSGGGRLVQRQRAGAGRSRKGTRESERAARCGRGAAAAATGLGNCPVALPP